MPAPPTAVFVTNYEMTLGAMIALNEAACRVPDDISVIGFDKLDLFGAMYPSLTLVKQPQNAIGECVAKQLLRLLSDAVGGAVEPDHHAVHAAVRRQQRTES